MPCSLKVWSLDKGHQHHLEPGGNAEPQAPALFCWSRICILIRSPEGWWVCSLQFVVAGEEKVFFDPLRVPGWVWKWSWQRDRLTGETQTVWLNFHMWMEAFAREWKPKEVTRAKVLYLLGKETVHLWRTDLWVVKGEEISGRIRVSLTRFVCRFLWWLLKNLPPVCHCCLVAKVRETLISCL